MSRIGRSRLLLLALLAGIAYAPSLRVGFLYDDHPLIESNAALRSCSIPDRNRDFLRVPPDIYSLQLRNVIRRSPVRP